jgi:hypothetical protein
MAMQVPTTGPNAKERQKRLAHLRQTLASLERLPVSQREAECADVREEAIRNVIAELERKQPD